MDAQSPKASRLDAYAALRVRDFRRFLSGHVISVLGVQMQTVAVGWQLYERTHSAWPLGLVGLVQVIPMLGFALFAGQLADRYDRRKILMNATLLAVAASLGLLLVTVNQWRYEWLYVCLFLSGTARAFQGPARSALMPQLVPRDLFSNSVSWAVSAFELASLSGPALGGWLIAYFSSTNIVYLLGAFTSLWYFTFLSALTKRSYVAEQQPGEADNFTNPKVEALSQGFRYVWHTKALFAAMSLDLFAVLFGGAVALLPIFAKDILGVGPFGLGWLQAAPSLGAVSMALTTTHMPPIKKAGRTLLFAVAAFGVATIIFGLSRNFWLSFLMLFLTGAFDNISVVIRHVLVQTLTPDAMRGRVSAVNGMFINASNELGRFESGALAALTSPVFSVIAGGLGTLIVVGFVALLSPKLRNYGQLDEQSSKH